MRLECTPAPGARLQRFVGDRLRVTLRVAGVVPGGTSAWLRTNLGRAEVQRAELIALGGRAPGEPATFGGSAWHDVPLRAERDGCYSLDVPLTEVGWFRAKPWLRLADGSGLWPEGEDVGVAVHPDRLRTANVIYCAFPRALGAHRGDRAPRPVLPAEEALQRLGYTVLPGGGTLRDVTRLVPYLFDRLGCRVLHLLPVGPVPTTFARMGRLGSPYAQLDLVGIDPALVELDHRTTAVDQFRELCDAVHERGGLVLLDFVPHHTGWGSRLFELHPEWFERNPDGTFRSPGAWGVVWGDLVELDLRHRALWDELADSLLTWCARGVDGFRCDAGYMVPLPVWQYVGARLRSERPDAVLLLEGLGGAWETTRTLLQEGGMQWAYSELFQNETPEAVHGYLAHALRHADELTLVHYSETHDNLRLARRGRPWSLLRNRLCALVSQQGAFGFTSGVEWLCTTRVDVHEAHGVAWGAEPNLVEELARLSRLLADHPCFFDGARVELRSAPGDFVLQVLRESAEGRDRCLVLANLDAEHTRVVEVARALWERAGAPGVDLLGQRFEAPEAPVGPVRMTLAPGQVLCLSDRARPRGMEGERYREVTALSAAALEALVQVLPLEAVGPAGPEALARAVEESPAAFLSSLRHVDPVLAARDLSLALAEAREASLDRYAPVVPWCVEDVTRVVPRPADHWLLITDPGSFDVVLERPDGTRRHRRAVRARDGWFVVEPPTRSHGTLVVVVDRHRDEGGAVTGRLSTLLPSPVPSRQQPPPEAVALLTNRRGSMARLRVDLGAVRSKYDCLLAANLHPEVPVDRHVVAKRLRAWAVVDGFLGPLDASCLVAFSAGPPARWRFCPHGGDGRRVDLELEVALDPSHDRVEARWLRPQGAPTLGSALPATAPVSVTLRVDLEDRNFHQETRLNEVAERWFAERTARLPDGEGFALAAAPGRTVVGRLRGGRFHEAPESSRGVLHPEEAERGLPAQGDAWSPGWFELPLSPGGEAVFTLEVTDGARTAAPAAPVRTVLAASAVDPLPDHALVRSDATQAPPRTAVRGSGPAASNELASRPPGGWEAPLARLRAALRAYLVRRGRGTTVIAGYPWFLDWGRDALVVARALGPAGHHEELASLLLTFGGLERRGTLPNALFGSDDGNRETSDAPLWLALAAEEAVPFLGAGLWDLKTEGGRTLREVLLSIATHWLRGTEVGVKVDVESGLPWSPCHFTWMDTRYPAGTPREGYPVELAALWVRLLRLLSAWEAPPVDGLAFPELLARATTSLDLFFPGSRPHAADTLHAPRDTPAHRAVPDDHLRPNHLWLASLGVLTDRRMRRSWAAARDALLVPGALRTLAPRTVSHPLPIRAPSGELLGEPCRPYRGRYAGPEDTSRKPAYHNGTAWPWLLPTFVEALLRLYPGDEAAVGGARAWLGSGLALLDSGCLGHLPELLDGDAPHTPRGADAQAWSVSELLRVALLLEPAPAPLANLGPA